MKVLSGFLQKSSVGCVVAKVEIAFGAMAQGVSLVRTSKS